MEFMSVGRLAWPEIIITSWQYITALRIEREDKYHNVPVCVSKLLLKQGSEQLDAVGKSGSISTPQEKPFLYMWLLLHSGWPTITWYTRHEILPHILHNTHRGYH